MSDWTRTTPQERRFAADSLVFWSTVACVVVTAALVGMGVVR